MFDTTPRKETYLVRIRISRSIINSIPICKSIILLATISRAGVQRYVASHRDSTAGGSIESLFKRHTVVVGIMALTRVVI